MGKRIRAHYRALYPLTDAARLAPELNPGACTVSRLGHEPRVALAVLQQMLAPHVSAGRLRVLAQTSEQRLPTMPDLPAVAEFSPGFAATFPYAMGAPAGTPQEIVARLNQAVGRIVQTPEVLERLRSFGLEPAYSTPQALRQAVAAEIAIWTRVVQTGGIKVE